MKHMTIECGIFCEERLPTRKETTMLDVIKLPKPIKVFAEAEELKKLEDFCRFSRQEIQKFPRCGKGSVEKLAQIMAGFNLYLRGEGKNWNEAIQEMNAELENHGTGSSETSSNSPQELGVHKPEGREITDNPENRRDPANPDDWQEPAECPSCLNSGVDQMNQPCAVCIVGASEPEPQTNGVNFAEIEKEIDIENSYNNPDIDPEEVTRAAYIHGGNMAAEYAKSIGKHDLATLTGDEWLTFCECLCKNYHSKFLELTSQGEPF